MDKIEDEEEEEVRRRGESKIYWRKEIYKRANSNNSWSNYMVPTQFVKYSN